MRSLRGTGADQFGNLLGSFRRLEVGTDDPAHGVQRGGLAIDQHGQVAGGDRLHRDHGTARHRPGERGRVAAEEHAPGDGADRPRPRRGARRRLDPRRPGSSPTRPTIRRRRGGAPECRSRLSEDGQHVARLERDEPGSLGVVADGQHDGQVGEGGVVTVERVVADVPGRTVLHAVEALGGSSAGASGETERDTGGRDADRPDRRTGGSTLEGPGPAGSWPPRRNGAPGRPRSAGARSPCPGPPPTARRRRLAGESRAQPAPPPGPPGQRGAGQGAETEGDRARADVRCACRRCDGASARSAHVSAVAGVAGVRRQAQSPSLPELVGVHEACAAADVAAEIERGERGPIRTVAQELVRDVPERVARPHRVGRAAAACTGDGRRAPGPRARAVSDEPGPCRPARWRPRRPPARAVRRGS